MICLTLPQIILTIIQSEITVKAFFDGHVNVNRQCGKRPVFV